MVTRRWTSLAWGVHCKNMLHVELRAKQEAYLFAAEAAEGLAPQEPAGSCKSSR
jgi:hypothetical protein